MIQKVLQRHSDKKNQEALFLDMHILIFQYFAISFINNQSSFLFVWIY